MKSCSGCAKGYISSRQSPWIKTLATQRLLKDEIDAFGNDEWLGNSSDLNVCEHVRAIMKDQVEGLMLQDFIHPRFSRFYGSTQTEYKLFGRRMEDSTAY